MDDKRYWIGFTLVKVIGAVRFQRLLKRFGNAESAWKLSPVDLAGAGLTLKLIEPLMAVREKADLSRLWDKIQAQDTRVLSWEDESYLQRLREIEQPPPVLYFRGELLAEDAWAVAIVGTQRVTHYGRQVPEKLAVFLAANGITVVSGLARGVDAIAHQTAMKAGGRTFAVLGSSMDRIYPPEHRALAEQIFPGVPG